MSVVDLFSKRQKKKEKRAKEVYSYDDIPPKCRVQVVQIMNEVLEKNAEHAFEPVVKTLRREYGLFELVKGGSRYTRQYELTQFFLGTRDILEAIDVIELIFVEIQRARIASLRGT